jgi:hypothetical protein
VHEEEEIKRNHEYSKNTEEGTNWDIFYRIKAKQKQKTWFLTMFYIDIN